MADQFQLPEGVTLSGDTQPLQQQQFQMPKGVTLSGPTKPIRAQVGGAPVTLHGVTPDQLRRATIPPKQPPKTVTDRLLARTGIPPGLVSGAGAFAGDIWGMAKGVPGQVIGSLPGINLLPDDVRSLVGLPPMPDPFAMGQDMAKHWQQQKQAGYSLPYRALTPVAEALGTNVRGMEQGAKTGDFGGILGHAAVPIALAAAPVVAHDRMSRAAFPEAATATERGAPSAAPTTVAQRARLAGAELLKENIPPPFRGWGKAWKRMFPDKARELEQLYNQYVGGQQPGPPPRTTTMTHPPTVEPTRRLVITPEEEQIGKVRTAQAKMMAREQGTQAAAFGKAGAKLDYAQRQELARRGYSAQQMSRLSKAQIQQIFGGT